jgi:hypothetical protein
VLIEKNKTISLVEPNKQIEMEIIKFNPFHSKKSALEFLKPKKKKHFFELKYFNLHQFEPQKNPMKIKIKRVRERERERPVPVVEEKC